MLKEFRTKHKLTQKQFAEIIGVSRTVYQNWEYNKKLPSYTQSMAILKAMDKIEKVSIYKIASYKYKQTEKLTDNKYIKKRYKIIKIIALIILIFIFTFLY